MPEFENTSDQMTYLESAGLDEKVAYLLDHVQITDVLQRYGQCVIRTTSSGSEAATSMRSRSITARPLARSDARLGRRVVRTR
jgi:hypothetical protein